MLHPHPVHSAVFQGRIVLSDLHKDPRGGITGLNLLIEEVWPEPPAKTSVTLRSGRKLGRASSVPPRSTFWSAMIVGERLGPLMAYLDQGLQGMPVVAGGRPAGGRPMVGGDKEVILLFRAEVQPDPRLLDAWLQEVGARVAAVQEAAEGAPK